MRTRTARPLPYGLVILHEDKDILVVDKPSGLLTIATEKNSDHTAYFVLTDYVRKGCVKSRNRVFIVHRLDKDTSGVLVFAKTEEVKRKLQDNWDQATKKYIAIVHGHLEKKSDTITSYLAESKACQVYSTQDPTKGKLAKTSYHTLRQTKAYTMVEVVLLTGRKNQIRVHFKDLEHPVVGDRKYGIKDMVGHLALHARSLAFPHPFNGKPMVFTAKIPPHFYQMIGNIDLDAPEKTEPTDPPVPPVPTPEDLGSSNKTGD
jgi:23S rRNA pseudouridine1911/1915/1917 synthase